MPDSASVLRDFLKLSAQEQRDVLHALAASGVDVKRLASRATALESYDTRRFIEGLHCPHCDSQLVVRNGKQADGTQRYRCRACGKTFQASTSTVLGSRLKKHVNALRKYVHCMCLELPIRRTAEECGISIPTAFAWRHRILDTLAKTLENALLQGVIEYDETFFALSFKGHRHMQTAVEGGIPLPSHQRGGAYIRKGIGLRQVCVPIAVSRNGGFVGKVSNLGTPSGQDALNVVGGHCADGSTLCSDGGRPAQRVASAEGLQLVRLTGGKQTRGPYNIQSVNAFHSGLKGMVNSHFKGVTTKYLNNYVVWYGFLHAAGEARRRDLEAMLFEIALTATCPTSTRDVRRRDSVPVLSESQKGLMELLLIELAQAEYKDRMEALRRLQKRGGLTDVSDDVPF